MLTRQHKLTNLNYGVPSVNGFGEDLYDTQYFGLTDFEFQIKAIFAYHSFKSS